jgi:prepilin-type N-terminal cleavage/methylation domain-containing protein
MRRQRAFTLIELVLVVATVAVLAAIGIPRYAQSMNRYRVDMAARRVVADLGLARSSARSSGNGQAIDFSTPANGYTFPGLASPDRRTLTYSVKLGDEPYKVTVSSVTLDGAPAGTTSLSFTRYGIPQYGGTIVLTSGGYSKSILLDAVTGRAEVQ